jgi:hypothetical protein
MVCIKVLHSANATMCGTLCAFSACKEGLPMVCIKVLHSANATMCGTLCAFSACREGLPMVCIKVLCGITVPTHCSKSPPS